jgi:hypothetical protein
MNFYAEYDVRDLEHASLPERLETHIYGHIGGLTRGLGYDVACYLPAYRI